jgi:glycosyltransferase involved in cell wall biosynthesis
VLVALAIAVLATLVATLAAGLAFESRLPAMRRAEPTEAAGGEVPRVSVVIPARDEEAVIARCVASCLAQDDVELEVIVVDDDSGDATAAEARRAAGDDPRLRVVPGRPLPDGWFGKQNAAAHGAGFASGDWFAFVDADSSLRPGALRAGVDSARRYGATFLSCWPEQRAPGFWEGRTQPWVVGLAAVADAFRRLWSPGWPVALSAWGPFYLVAADAYRRTGGHAMIADRNIEDSEFARAMGRAGERAVTLDGRRFVSTLMYEGLPALMRGWGKNLYLGLGARPLPALLVVLYVLVLGLGPLALLVAGVARGHALAIGLAAVALLLQALVGRLFAERVVVAPARRWTAAGPIGALTFVAILVTSMVRTELGIGFRWKGREYA